MPDWELVIDPASFDRLRTDRAFGILLNLARLTNALTIGRWALLAPLRWQSPRLRRERFAALLYTGALLHEGLRLAEALPAFYRHLPQYRAGFGEIQADSKVRHLRKRYLKRLRNKVAFHFDHDVPATVLPRLRNSEYHFATGRGGAIAAIYFDLADDVVTDFLLGKSSSDAEYVQKLDEFMTGTADLFKRFMIASHRLIPAALREQGWVRRQVVRSRRRASSASGRAP